MSSPDRHFYEFGEFRLDVANRRLVHRGEVVPLRPMGLEILLLLIERREHVVRPEDFKPRVWQDTSFDPANLMQNIYLLRKALGKDEHGKHFIRNFPKNGYQFVAPVIEVWEDHPPPALPSRPSPTQGAGGLATRPSNKEALTTSPDRTSPAADGTGRRWKVVFAVVGVLLAGLITWRISSSTTKQLAIAVLPFRSLAAEPEEDSLRTGLADTLITRLCGQAQILVRPTTAVLRYAGADRDSVEIGRELKVDVVLEGSVQRGNDRVRVTARLLRVRDRQPLWADQYDEQWRNVFAVQDQISEQIVAALALKLSSDEQRRLTKHYTDNLDAYLAYTKGRYFWNKRDEESLRKAIDCFDQAVKLDHNYALAFAGLADAQSMLNDYAQVPAHATYQQALAAARQAVAQDDSLAEAHTALAYVQAVYEWKWKEAEASYRRALALSPGYAIAHQWYGDYLSARGRHDEAVAHTRRALELDPLSLSINASLALTWYYKRDYERAIRQCRETIEMDSHFLQPYVCLYAAYLAKGNYEQAFAEYSTLRKMRGDDEQELAALRQAFAAGGWKGVMQHQLSKLLNSSDPSSVANTVAICYTDMGERQQAVEWLEKAFEARARGMMYLKVAPRLDGLRGEPRFQDLLRKVGLVN